MRKFKGKSRFLKLGHYYQLRWKWDKDFKICKLIQPTEKGFNFLILETNKCFLKHHLYPLKKLSEGLLESEQYFYINEFIEIEKIRVVEEIIIK